MHLWLPREREETYRDVTGMACFLLVIIQRNVLGVFDTRVSQTSKVCNNNNNLILRSRDKGPPPRSDLTAKVYGGVHTPPPSEFEPVTS